MIWKDTGLWYGNAKKCPIRLPSGWTLAQFKDDFARAFNPHNKAYFCWFNGDTWETKEPSEVMFPGWSRIRVENWTIKAFAGLKRTRKLAGLSKIPSLEENPGASYGKPRSK